MTAWGFVLFRRLARGWRGSRRRLATTDNATFYAIERTAGDRKVVGLFNLTARDATADLFDPVLAGEWRDAFTGETVTLGALVPLEMKAWRYRVLVR